MLYAQNLALCPMLSCRPSPDMSSCSLISIIIFVLYFFQNKFIAGNSMEKKFIFMINLLRNAVSFDDL